MNGDGYADVIVGAESCSNSRGRAYVYYGNSYSLSLNPDWKYTGDKTKGYFGHCVASAGDVNRDGYADVIIGAFVYSNDQTNEGKVYVFHGSYKGLLSSYQWSCESNQEEAVYGLPWHPPET